MDSQASICMRACGVSSMKFLMTTSPMANPVQGRSAAPFESDLMRSSYLPPPAMARMDFLVSNISNTVPV